MQIVLRRFRYPYMEYEKVFCSAEISSIFPGVEITEAGLDHCLEVDEGRDLSRLPELTYIESYCIDGCWRKTIQGMLEDDGTPPNKQHTRYSTHGLHEYKGKFNPQIVRAVANHVGVTKKSVILDPFNGSGTTLVECAHAGIAAYGADINPMACFISNVKVGALSLDLEETRKAIAKIETGLREKRDVSDSGDDRIKYLLSWVPAETLAKLEYIRSVAGECTENVRDYLLLIASDLIRDYSNQEPGDLRIRRRMSEFPDKPFEEAFCADAEKHLLKIERMQRYFPGLETENFAYHCDIRHDDPFGGAVFDAAITSPPYVTALPYIDTQRISLVWLGLCRPSDIIPLEASLIGSRELLKSEKQRWRDAIVQNTNDLPAPIYELAWDMYSSLGQSDGFRRQAVPALMYRYFSDMQQMFMNVHKLVRPNGSYALVVGHNRTTLGGKEYLIDTPKLLSVLAEACGWKTAEILPLQTYKRYGINSKNSIHQESLVVLENCCEEG